MPTPGNRPTDELLIEAARVHVSRLLGPSAVPRRIIVQIHGSDPIALPVPPVGPAAGPALPPFVPNDPQSCLLDALAGHAYRGDGLAEASGISRSQMYRHPGGLKELQERGLVASHPRLGYFRPDAPPDELATPAP